MEKITQTQYLELIAGAEVLEKDGFGLKVLDTKKGEMIKLFRRKRLFSTALFKPYALRFADNAQQLRALGIPSITVNRLLWCAEIQRHIVIYQRLEGELLRDVLSEKTTQSKTTFEKFAAFIAQLHQSGVYFRSAHLRNILVQPNGELALIDISDMQIKAKALSLALRKRNFEHILRYQEDKDLLTPQLDNFISIYTDSSKLSPKLITQLRRSIESTLQ
ncbi:MAG: lipopolysaccharide kinase InaA family protein [Cycloclasticus sp.]